MADIDVNVTVGGCLPVTVALMSATADVFQGSGILAGWSLRDGTTAIPLIAEGNVVAPGAGATIIQLTGLAAGTYQATWTVGLQGPAAAADANNFQLKNAVAVVSGSINPGVAGEYPQAVTEVTVLAGGTVSIIAIGAGTAGVTYSAQLALTPTTEVETVVEMTSGQDVVGEASFLGERTTTQWFGNGGPIIQNKVTMNIVQGAVRGTIYVIPT